MNLKTPLQTSHASCYNGGNPPPGSPVPYGGKPAYRAGFTATHWLPCKERGFKILIFLDISYFILPSPRRSEKSERRLPPIRTFQERGVGGEVKIVLVKLTLSYLTN
jgi:hypothetical protein